MKHRSWIVVLSLLFFAVAAVWPAAAASGDDFFFHDGDRVVMVGDSITEQHLYSNYVEMWTVSRFPKWNVTFRNVGIGGDRSTGGNSRFKRDVLVHKPTAITVDFGMNDGNYRAFDETGFMTYMGGLQGMADQAKAASIRVAWLTPSPVEKAEDGPAIEGYNQTLEKYSEGVKKIAADNGGLFVDQFHPFVAAIDKARNASHDNRIGKGDAVHPGPPGQAVMAWAILKGLNFPRLVSRVEIDAGQPKVVASEKCRVSELAAENGGLTFERADEALPFFPIEAESINEWVPVREELNQYGLKVTGLKPGKYELRLSGTKVADYTADELAGGVNLSKAVLAAGPIAEQVNSVWTAVKAKNSYYHDRVFRGIVLAFVSIPDFLNVKLEPAEIEARRQSAITERMTKLPELDEAIRQALAPRAHRVELVPKAG
ncbi:MAG TPA: SGNH/GDSL hydrolase family protein [Pirellulales bacterium]|nr:SGNH/GDSL hydrolase family protein [Pirellulales bacterium]